MRRTGNHLPQWQLAALIASGSTLLLTGIAWLPLHYLVGAGTGELPHPGEAWLMRLHGLAGFAALFVFGALAAAHVPQGWRLVVRRGWSRQRASGLLLCSLFGLLAATGYALYYFAPEPVRPTLGWAHASIGVAMAVAVLRHRRRRRKGPAPAGVEFGAGRSK